MSLFSMSRSVNSHAARDVLTRGDSGLTLVEVMVAVVILGMTLFGVMAGISYMNFRNRESSQRMLASSIETEILELFKAQPFPQITNSTGGNSIYLKSLPPPPGGPPWDDPRRWPVPPANAWQSLPVEDVAPGDATAPALLPDKLPNGAWRADFVLDPANPTLQQVTVTLRWKLYQGDNQRFVSLSTSTTVCQSFPGL